MSIHFTLASERSLYTKYLHTLSLGLLLTGDRPVAQHNSQQETRHPMLLVGQSQQASGHRNRQSLSLWKMF